MNIAQEIGKLLKKKGWRLSVAESCTGGAIADAITNVPGSSEYFECGVVVYSNESKRALLGVRPATLQKHGAVSEAAACAMADGVRRRCGADIGLAVTGIAGPGGGTKEKPVGTVFLALALASDTAASTQTSAKHFCFPQGRLKFKKSVVAAALDWLRKELL